MPTTMNINEILQLLPHRYPLLLIDKVVDYEIGISLVAIKNITINEPYFQGHFPEHPIMPGVLLIEAMAQAAGILIYLTAGRQKDDLYVFAGIDKVRFRKIVTPGDQLYLHVKVERCKLNVWKFTAEARVNNEVACSADITIAK